LGIGADGSPVAANETKRVWLELTYFYGLGALIVFFGAMALGRLSIRSVRDIEWAERPVTAPVTAERATAERATAEPVTATEGETEEMRPATTEEPRRRSWRDLFRTGGGQGGHRRLAHH